MGQDSWVLSPTLSPTSTPPDLEILEHMNEYIQIFLNMSGDTGNAEIPSELAER